MSRKTSRKSSLAVLLPVLGCVLFLWGYISHRNGMFPSDTVEKVLSALPVFQEADEGDTFSLDMAVTTPYAAGTPVTDKDEKSGVVINDSSRSYNGYNLFNSANTSKVLLINMAGDVVYEWDHEGSESFHHAVIDDNGGLYAIEYGRHLVRLDRDSNEIWSYDEPCHHDVCVGPDGLVYVLARYPEKVPGINFGREIFVDYIHVLDTEGSFIKSISFMDMFRDPRFGYLLPTTNIYEKDIFHANSITVLDGSLADLDPVLYKKGNILFSLRNINLVGIFDQDAEKLLWVWGPGNIYMQHNATLLDNGNVLLFDNGEAVSRVLEIDPSDNSLAWSFGGGTSDFFFSMSRGSAQRLPNGNTLVGVSDKGYSFEVTGGGQVVWRFVNPYVYEEGNKVFRGAFYRMTRIPPEAVTSLRDGSGKR